MIWYSISISNVRFHFEKFNHTSLHPMNLPLIGQGAGHKGGNYKTFRFDLPKLAKSIRWGVENGMDFIDTAENYGNGRSEIVIGTAIADIRNEIKIASKFSTNHHAFNEIIDSLHKSLIRLKVSYLDLYQMHWPNKAIPLDETLEALWQLKKDGKILEVGLCNVNKNQLCDAIEIAKRNGEKIFSVQIKFNLNETFAYSQIEELCRIHRIRIIAYSPIRNVLTVSEKKYSLLNRIAEEVGATPVQVALNWVISHPLVTAIPESSKLEHITELARANRFQLSVNQIQDLTDNFKPKILNINVNSIFSKNTRRKSIGLGLKKSQIEIFSEDFCPSIIDLSDEIKSGDFLQPITVKPIEGVKDKFEILDGELRFWAFVYCHGPESMIPAIILLDE